MLLGGDSRKPGSLMREGLAKRKTISREGLKWFGKTGLLGGPQTEDRRAQSG